jgi:nickel-type superoxide dismutase maturation protease
MREAGGFDRILVLLGSRQAVRVGGDSMIPTLDDGDVVIIKSRFIPEIGDVVLVDHPFKQSVSMLKRIAEITDSGRFELRGDNLDESTDSRTFGSVPLEYIKGKAVCRLKRNDRRRGTGSKIS